MFRWLCGKPGVAMSGYGEVIIIKKLDLILANQEKIMSGLSDLQASVAAEDSVIAKAVTLLQGLSAALAAAGTDPAALAALKTDIDARTAALSAEVAKDALP